jgi:hypothetical protein
MKLQFALASLMASLASAQLAEPPPVLKIVREYMKPGKGAAHEKNEAAFARAFQNSKFPNYIGWEAVSGPTQVWFVEGYANYAGIEAAMKISTAEPLKSTLEQLEAADGELRTGESTTIAYYAKQLSYFPVPLNLTKTRFVWVDMVRIRRGRADDYAELRKIQNAAFEKVGAKWQRAVYVVGNGAAATEYLVVRPMESLSEMDAPAHWNNRETLGEAFERYRTLTSDIIVSADDILFAVNPKMSNPPKAFLDADPGFWVW